MASIARAIPPLRSSSSTPVQRGSAIPTGGRPPSRSSRVPSGTVRRREPVVVDDSEEAASAALRRHAGSPLITAIGGDGTVRNAAEILAGRSTPLAIVPAGTGNVLAASLGVRGVRSAVTVIRDGVPRDHRPRPCRVGPLRRGRTRRTEDVRRGSGRRARRADHGDGPRGLEAPSAVRPPMSVRRSASSCGSRPTAFDIVADGETTPASTATWRSSPTAESSSLAASARASRSIRATVGSTCSWWVVGVWQEACAVRPSCWCASGRARRDGHPPDRPRGAHRDRAAATRRVRRRHAPTGLARGACRPGRADDPRAPSRQPV